VSGFRRAAELRAGPLLVLVSRLPPFAVFGAVLGLLVGGLLLQGPLGLVMVAVVAAFVGLQVYFAWPVLPPAQRVLRLAVLTLVVGAAVAHA
jgi:hypothetical protein